MAKLRMNINGIEVTGYDGQSVLDVAKENGIEIPTLCHDERVAVYGSCGLCVVEQEGNPKLLRSCATVISEGMVIKTNTEKVKESRKTALELLLSDHTGDCRPPCALGCPAGTDCQGYVGMVANGELKQAVKLIKDKFPFPSAIGRVCPHPCETACRRQMVEEPVSIAFIKSYIGDKDLESGTPYMLEVGELTGHTVAVIGGGPAGLTAAYHLRAKGHEVTVFDAMPKMGGMLRYGIPEYRLPKSILQQEIDLIEDMGIKMLNNIKIGEDISFNNLKDTYDAVIVAVGAWTSIKMGVKGEDNKNVHGGIDFLRQVSLNEDVLIGQKVAIVGGGNTAMDACRTAVRLGAKEVYCVYRRTKAEMPAEDIEIKEAEEEGVIFKYLTNPVDIAANEDGSINYVKLQKMELGEPDESGRRSPVPIEGETEDLEVDSVIMALGQILDSKGIEDVELTRRKTIAADELTFRTNIEKVFAIGDATNEGAGIAIAAIAEAEKAAIVIDSYLKGAVVPYKKPYVVERHDLTEADFADRKKEARAIMPHLSPEKRKDNFHEVNHIFSDEEAIRECKRCLECGCHDYFECKLISYANDMDVEPEKYAGEVHNRVVDNSHPFIDRNPDKCILCGLCVRVCDEMMGRTALGLVDRGFDTVVKPALDLPLRETDCISCGQCITLCPTGALGEKLSIKKSTPVETTHTDTMCAFCSIGCKTTVETKGVLVVKSVPKETENGALCVNGRFGFGHSFKDGRLTTPLVRKDGELVPVSWEEANIFIAKKLQSTAVRHGSDALAVSVSDKLTNEEIYLAKKYANEILKTDTVFSYGLNRSGVEAVTGYDGSTSKIEELLSTEVIVLVGTDLMKEHAVLGVRVRQAIERGAKTIVISKDCETQEAQEADIFVKAERVEDIKSVLKAIADLGGKADAIDFTGVQVSKDAKAAAEMIMKAKKAMVVIDQFNLKAEAAKAAAEIAVISGHIGSPRNGIIQVKGNVNSQGACDIGIGTLCATRETLSSGKIKAMLVVGEEPENMEVDKNSLEFLAVADIYLTETARKADAVLPLVSLTESNGTVTSCDGTINNVKAAIPPLSKENFEVIQGLANAMKESFDYKNVEAIAQEMSEKSAFKKPVLNLEVRDAENTTMYIDKINPNVSYAAFTRFLESEGIR